MSLNEEMMNFENSPGWRRVLEQINSEFNKHIAGVRLAGRHGRVADTATHVAWCDALEWVSNLPEQMRKRNSIKSPAKGEKNDGSEQSSWY